MNARERMRAFNGSGGALTWNGRPFFAHPHRCECQGADPVPHRHYDVDGACARCRCSGYRPAFVLDLSIPGLVALP